MKILALNAGTASLKFRLYSMPEEKPLVLGQLKNYSDSRFLCEISVLDKAKETYSITEQDWENRVDYITKLLFESGVVDNFGDIDIVVHRIVHGGEKYKTPVILTPEVIEDLETNFTNLAPLHNPVALQIVQKIFEKNVKIKQVAVFDTSFNLTIPKESYLYAIPKKYYEKYKVRRYGFHGISHNFVVNEFRRYQKDSHLKPQKSNKIISCHLGSGCSICAISGYNVVDNSFGFSPMENVIMSTRVGEIDYDAVKFIQSSENLSDKDVQNLLTKQSGLLGITGYTKDMKKILEDRENIPESELAIKMFINSVVKNIGQMFLSLGGMDVLIFTGGIGEGSDVIRREIVKKLLPLGVVLDDALNNGAIDVDRTLNITGENSNCGVWVVPTNEELQMCREVLNLA